MGLKYPASQPGNGVLDNLSKHQACTSIDQVLVNAALANHHIQHYLSDPPLNRIWTLEAIDRNPNVLVEFEHVTVIGGPGELLATAKHKKFGHFLGIKPLGLDDPVHPTRILFIYEITSPYNRRVEQRRALKRMLGRQHRSLVTKAARATNRDFLKFDLTPEGAKAINRRLKLDPGRFWRVAKGKEFLDLPKPALQLLLFDLDQ